MKLITLLLIGSLVFISCKPKCDRDAQIIRDCTGTYIRVDNKDYKVCNVGIVSGRADNVIIKVKYKRLDSCSKKSEPMCLMAHDNQGWVEILEVD